MDQISYAHSAKQSKRIKRFIAEPDSTSGLVSLPKVIEAGESITIPDGRVVVHPNLEINGTLTIENDGELFVPFGGTLVSSDLMHPVDTIDDLRNETGKYKYAYVTGYHTKDDGAFGSNMFVWDEDSTETDNGGTNIKCTTVTTGRYKLKYSGAVNVKWFGAKGDGIADDWTSLNNAWLYCIAFGLNLYLPSGEYVTYNKNFPFRQTGTPTSLLDCNGTIVYGDGVTTILKTISINGADVLQINGLKNVSFEKMKVIASISGTIAGSNGVSITNGYDNLDIDIIAENLPSLDKTTYIDGGKALSIQPSTTINECGTLKANIYAKGCAEGFGLDINLSTMTSKKMSVNVNVVAENCYRGFKYSAAAATAAVPVGFDCGVTVKVTSINCQQDTVIVRGHGINIANRIVTTKTSAERRLDSNGLPWIASDTTVEALYCAYAKNSKIIIDGYKGNCDYKARVGGIQAGASGQTGETENSTIILDISGVSSILDFDAINAGGNISKNNLITATANTLSSYPTLITNAVYKNTTLIGTVNRLVSPIIAEKLSLAMGTDGIAETGLIDLFNLITGIQGKATSSPNAIVTGLYDQAGNLRLGIRNGTGLVVDSKTSSDAIGAYIGKHAVYDKDNVFIGYFPYYA